MRAVLSREPGGPETLVVAETADAPAPGPGELTIRVHAAGVNFPDALIIEDRYQVRPPRPFSPGAEVAGVVEAVGPDVTGFAKGDRVMAFLTSGGMAEQVTVEAWRCHPLTEGIGFVEAAALQMTYGTALYGLQERGDLKAGETVLVLGAGGGVGLAAVELAVAAGARVVAAASSEEKLALARDRGAEGAVLYPATVGGDREAGRALANAFKEAMPDGADIVFDTVGGGYAEPALRTLAWGGRYLVVGFPAGIPSIPLNLTLLKSCDIRGVFWGAAVRRDPAAHHRAMDELLALHARGAVKPPVADVLPLDRAGEAIARLSGRGVTGKLVLELA
ncbi:MULTISPECIES: NADPH:quinone oxidoreductase family protein [unclassified Haematobacter]|uniref:NADPH:quinone oxidoreductase family protein n=1 Tax=unclassified Haematobacter TaxID=2640585 RepID=UPI0025C3A2BD|nr:MULTISPECIES: NADPH:quinone oxidoreductase family protein [unclassified Haematobacter]